MHTGVCVTHSGGSLSPVKMLTSGPQTDTETERTDIQLLIKTNLILAQTQSKHFKLYRNLPVELFTVSCHSVDSGITSFQNRFPFRKIKTFPVFFKKLISLIGMASVTERDLTLQISK